jgi:hypothetical protein
VDQTPSLKTQVQKEVLVEIIHGLTSKTMKLDEAQAIARETLAASDKIERHEESVMEFYNELAKNHKRFLNLYTKVKGDILRDREVTAYRDALSAIDAGNIDAAHQIAKSALSTTANETTITK